VSRRIGNGLVWAILALGVTAAVAAFGPPRDELSSARASAPGHDKAGCRPCRSESIFRGRALPFEIDDRTVRPDPGPDATDDAASRRASRAQPG
jgi:hypothetical protein